MTNYTDITLETTKEWIALGHNTVKSMVSKYHKNM